MGLCSSKEETAPVGPTTGRTTANTATTASTEKTGNVTNSTLGTETHPVSQDNLNSHPRAQSASSRKQSIVPSETSLTSSNKAAAAAMQNGKDSHDYTKVLLLGTGESGKSTILQQLRILHSNGFSEQELFDFKPFIFSNIVSSAKDIVQAYRRFDVKLEESDQINESDFDDILAYQSPVDPSAHFDKNLALKIAALWKNASTTQLIMDHRQDFYLMDSAKYFFEELDRISQEDYIPSVTDIIRTRKKTSGIFDLKFELQGLKIHIFDVGGQRSERKKWIYCFDNVASIIFCVALSEYDQSLLEEKSQNRLEESLTLFDSVVNSRWFSKCSIILFLNKIDVFIEKLPYSPLEKYFPDYKGGNDVNKATKYILWRFSKVNRSGLPIYPYITQATDTNNMSLVFVVVKESIFANILQDTGLLS
ncbi:Guanine nucleotide-binding protein alpha-2 subunit [Cyberlindnera fabianii]|uniref:Guanine nucleotide-binding protein alpha-2 subunit n=1 Tax=Cyberlindnera fabianii TaxID=36022 RepID=A0A1V2LA30_CYBFA|nr:Guanine nucleotide-binding protein alpha-2 subunit [Cyberlindnera fabianii]